MRRFSRQRYDTTQPLLTARISFENQKSLSCRSRGEIRGYEFIFDKFEPFCLALVRGLACVHLSESVGGEACLSFLTWAFDGDRFARIIGTCSVFKAKSEKNGWFTCAGKNEKDRGRNTGGSQIEVMWDYGIMFNFKANAEMLLKCVI